MKDDWTDATFASNWEADPLAGSPTRPFLISLVVAILAQRAAGGPIAILEIGSGSGLVSERILDAVPGAAIDAVDFSPPMMARAAERLARHGGRFRQLTGDLRNFDAGILESARYDVVLILQVLHEVPRAAKIDVLAKLRDHVAAGGLVLYGERLRAQYDLFAQPHDVLWNDLCRLTPTVEQPGFADRAAKARAKDDFTTDLAGELAAFAEAGYVVEPLVVLGERCLLAAIPADVARRKATLGA